MTGILEKLTFEGLKKRRRDSRIILFLYKGPNDTTVYSNPFMFISVNLLSWAAFSKAKRSRSVEVWIQL